MARLGFRSSLSVAVLCAAAGASRRDSAWPSPPPGAAVAAREDRGLGRAGRSTPCRTTNSAGSPAMGARSSRRPYAHIGPAVADPAAPLRRQQPRLHQLPPSGRPEEVRPAAGRGLRRLSGLQHAQRRGELDLRSGEPVHEAQPERPAHAGERAPDAGDPRLSQGALHQHSP